MVEVELRSFVTDGEYNRLLGFFLSNAKDLGEDEQITYYFEAPQDVRIQLNSQYAKLWLKGGKIHDEQREEIEIRFAREEFEKMEKLFASLGYGVKIKWFRKRHSFDWQGIAVALDDTKGYGKILELELLVEPAKSQTALENLKSKMSELNITVTPREEFDRRFKEYEANWRTLV